MKAKYERCPSCYGTGYQSGLRLLTDCFRCHGEGRVELKDRKPVQLDWHWAQAEQVEVRS